ncbi:MAG: DUF4126 domain-containing protein, partial [Phycisphaerae bacterium]|nr:DUF4126 domain-containing protein [Phycisphaerae bacterium]
TNALGSIGFFSSRVFLPALMTAVMLRFGPHVWPLDHAPLVMHVAHTPTWFTSDLCIAILTVLSVLEILGQKNADVRRLMHEFDVGAKAAMALLCTFGIASSEDSKFVQQTMHQAGISAAAIPGLIAVIGTISVGRVRGAILSALHEMDPDDVLRLQHLISWAEDAWVIFGVILLILSPILMLILIGIVIGLLALVRNRLAAREEGKRVACVGCGEMIYPCAMACPRCRTAVAQPRAIGFLGQSKEEAEPDVADHPLRLLEKKRCPVCATHLKHRTPHQSCPICHTDITAKFDGYTPYITGRLPVVLTICAGLSLIPLLGLVFGSVYFRLLIVNPFIVYLPFGERFLLKWSIRILFVILTFLQIVPVVGIVVVPLMAIVSFLAYRSAFESRLATPPPEILPVAMPSSAAM